MYEKKKNITIEVDLIKLKDDEEEMNRVLKKLQRRLVMGDYEMVTVILKKGGKEIDFYNYIETQNEKKRFYNNFKEFLEIARAIMLEKPDGKQHWYYILEEDDRDFLIFGTNKEISLYMQSFLDAYKQVDYEYNWDTLSYILELILDEYYNPPLQFAGYF